LNMHRVKSNMSILTEQTPHQDETTNKRRNKTTTNTTSH
jgi:hypothetical protein